MASCNKHIMVNVYERNFYDKDAAVSNVYYKLHEYEMDSIPLDLWMRNYVEYDTLKIEQRMIRKTVNKNSMYGFVFSSFLYPSVKYYNFKIMFSGNKKDYIKY